MPEENSLKKAAQEQRENVYPGGIFTNVCEESSAKPMIDETLILTPEMELYERAPKLENALRLLYGRLKMSEIVCMPIDSRDDNMRRQGSGYYRGHFTIGEMEDIEALLNAPRV